MDEIGQQIVDESIANADSRPLTSFTHGPRNLSANREITSRDRLNSFKLGGRTCRSLSRRVRSLARTRPRWPFPPSSTCRRGAAPPSDPRGVPDPVDRVLIQIFARALLPTVPVWIGERTRFCLTHIGALGGWPCAAASGVGPADRSIRPAADRGLGPHHRWNAPDRPVIGLAHEFHPCLDAGAFHRAYTVGADACLWNAVQPP